jgi:hypothetical protein
MQSSPLRRSLAFRIARDAGIGVLTFFFLNTGYRDLMSVIRSDPFAPLEQGNPLGLTDRIGIRFNDVELKAYNKSRLVTSATVDRLDVTKDRQTYQLLGIRKGSYKSGHGVFEYDAPQGIWNASSRQLVLTGGTHVSSKNLDLDTPTATFDSNQDILRADRQISGHVNEGIIRAANLVLNTKTEDYETGPIEYHGTLAGFQKGGDGDEAPATKRWDISSPHAKTNGDMVFYTHATAADDELILKADLIQQNKKTDVLTAFGNVLYYSGKADIRADKAIVYRTEHRVVLVSRVTMLVKPKSQQDKPPTIEPIPAFERIAPEKVEAGAPKPVSDPHEKELDDALRNGHTIRDYPFVTVCDKVEYWYQKGQRHAHITGMPQARQRMTADHWRDIWATSADYDAEKDLLLMKSTPDRRDLEMKNSKGDDLLARSMLVSTKEDAKVDQYDGDDVIGHTYSDSDEDGAAGNGKSTAKPTPPAKPTGSGNSNPKGPGPH